MELTGGANGHSAVRTTSLATLKGSFFFFFTSDFEELVVASVGSWRSCVGGKRGLLFILHVFCPSRPNAAPHWLKGQRPQQCVKTRSKDKSQGLDPQPSATKTETCPTQRQRLRSLPRRPCSADWNFLINVTSFS